jgi:hypothetical protein
LLLELTCDRYRQDAVVLRPGSCGNRSGTGSGWPDESAYRATTRRHRLPWQAHHFLFPAGHINSAERGAVVDFLRDREDQALEIQRVWGSGRPRPRFCPEPSIVSWIRDEPSSNRITQHVFDFAAQICGASQGAVERLILPHSTSSAEISIDPVSRGAFYACRILGRRTSPSSSDIGLIARWT